MKVSSGRRSGARRQLYRPGPPAWRLAWTLISLVLSSVHVTVFAAPQAAPPTTNSPPPLRYRRVLVPAEQLQKFTSGYRPMQRSKLLSEIERINSTGESIAAEGASIQSAEYSAVFASGQLTSGSAELRVLHLAGSPATLVLSPCGLALGPATWQATEGPEDAVMGSDLQGNLLVEVPASGDLRFSWTLQGVTDEWGETHFDVLLPPGPLNRLIVDLPAEYELLADQGMVAHLGDSGSATDPATAPASGMRRWEVRLGGVHRFALTVASQDAMRRRRQLVSLQQDLVYRLADDGLEVESNIELDVQREPLGVLLFSVDAQLQITSVRLGNRDVSWSLLDAPEGQLRQLQVRFSEPLSGIHRTLQLSAVGPLRTGATWKLPQILPREVFWRQGTVTLLIPDSLELRHLQAQDARQSDATPADAATKLAARRFQLFAPDGSLSIQLARRARQLRGIVGTTVELDPGTTTAHVVADLACVQGQRYTLRAEMPSVWTLDSIDAEPANSIEDYQVVYEAETKRLLIRLAQPLSPTRSLRLNVRAHRAPAVALEAEDFRPVKFTDVELQTRVVAIAPDPSFHIDVSGDIDVAQLDPEALEAPLANLVRPRSGGVVFQDGQPADTMTIQVTREDPSFAAEIHLLAEADTASLRESYRLLCTPESTPLTSLLVFLSETRPEEIAWSLNSNTNALLSVRRIPQQELQPARISQTGEAWELILRNPQDKPLEIRGVRKTAFHTSTKLALATMPRATSQEGWLAIHSLDATPLVIKASAVRPIPGVPVEPTVCTTERARYRFDPSRNPEIVIDHLNPANAQASLWAWNCLLSTQISRRGEVVQLADFLLENNGRTEFQLELPEGSVLNSIEIDGTPASRPRLGSQGEHYTITLPATQRFPRVEVRYHAPATPLGMLTRLTTQFPTLDIPVLHRQWTVWLPPGYAAGRDQPQLMSPSAASPTWSERLLGGLAARNNQLPFRIFAASDWGASGDGRSELEKNFANGWRFAQQLGERYQQQSGKPPGKPLTWRELLTAYHAQMAQGEAQVWVDVGRLTAEGFSFDRLARCASEGEALQVGTQLLADEQLVVVAAHGRLLLTSRDALARTPGTIMLRGQPAVVAAEKDSALDSELQALEHWMSADLVPLAGWLAAPVLSTGPWSRRRDAARFGIGEGHWRACEVAVGPNGSGELVVEHPLSVWAIGWAVLVMTAGLTTWLAARWPRSLSALLWATPVVAMLVPDTWTPVGSSLFLGTVVAGLLGLVRRAAPWRTRLERATAGRESDSSRSAPTGAITTTSGILLLARGLVLGSSVLEAGGDEPLEQVPAASLPGVYQIRVPVDKNLQPAGDYDYLPVEMYDHIQHRATASAHALRRWLVQRADFRAVLNWTERRSSLSLTSLTVTYQLILFQTHPQIVFPWPAKDPSVRLLELRLAGKPLEIAWNADRTAFSFQAPMEGAATLELVLLPETREEAGHRSLQFLIPPVAHAELEIVAPYDAPEIEVPSAVGEVRADSATGTRRVELGPARALALRWLAGNAGRVDSTRLDVQQLMWLKVRPKDRPDTVMLDTKFRIQAATGQIRDLTLRMDSRLRLLPPTNETTMEITTREEQSDELTTLDLAVREPTDRDVTLHLQFLILNTTGLGNLSLPRLELQDSRVERRWLAVSIAPELEYNASGSEAFAPMDAAEFLTVWGEAETAPNLCYRLQAVDPMWSLSTRSRQPTSEAQQQLDISIGPAAMELVFDAEVVTMNGSAFQHELAVPRNLQVTNVAIAQQESVIPAEARHDGSGRLTLFLGQGVTGPHHVQLRGITPLPTADETIPIPAISLQDATTKSQTIRLYRQSNVLVNVQTPASWQGVETGSRGLFREHFGRLLAAFEPRSLPGDDSTSATLQIRPNHPSLETRLVTTLRRLDDKWEAIADFQAEVAAGADGVIDQFRFEVPAEWSGPFSLEPAFPFEMRPMPGQRRHLIIRPLQPVTERFAVRIRGPLVLGANERGRAPNIIPLDVAHSERFYVLPTQLDQQRIAWETSGLQQVPLRDAIPVAPADARTMEAYRVYARPRAVITDIQRVAGQKQISLADIHILCHADGLISGVVSFDLEPAGIGSCTLDIPADCQLVQASMEGVPATMIPLSDRRWQLQLASEQLPQQLSILFQARCPSVRASTSYVLTVPWLTDFDVIRTLWTVHSAPGLLADVPAIAAHRVEAAAQEAIRLRSTANLVESAVETAMGSPATEIHGWYSPWAARLSRSQGRLARDRWRQSSADRNIDSAAIEAIRAQQESVAKRLDMPPATRDGNSAADQAHPSELLASTPDPLWQTRHLAFIGKEPTLPIQWAAPAGHLVARHFWVALLTALIGGGILSVLRTAPVRVWCRQWPGLVGVLFGWLWWLVASPSALGWVIIGASLWVALRFPLPSHILHSPAPETAAQNGVRSAR